MNGKDRRKNRATFPARKLVYVAGKVRTRGAGTQSLPLGRTPAAVVTATRKDKFNRTC